MRLPDLFKRGRSPIAGPDAQDRAEKLLADAFRLMGQLCGKLADLIEAQRLSRQGYDEQDRYLERLDPDEKPPPRGDAS
jgi:YD repeat-containing protein